MPTELLCTGLGAWLLPVLLSTAFAQQPTARASGSISGHIIRADTGAPLANALVRLDLASVQPPDTQWLRTAPDGAYRFDQLDSATYTVTASRSEFAARGYADDKIQGMQASWLHLESGQTIQNVDIRLSVCTPQSCRTAEPPAPLPGRRPWTISGTLRDENGVPIDGTLGMVFAVEVRYLPSGEAVGSYSGRGTLDEQGNFEIEGVLEPRDSSKRVYLGVTSIGPNGRAYTTSYYPGEPSLDTAQRLEIAPGKEIDGLRMVVRTQAAYSIRGKIAPKDASTTLQRYMIGVRTVGSILPPFDGEPTPVGHAVVDTDGSFTVRGVQAGEYILNAQEAKRDVYGETVSYQPVFGSSVGTGYVSVSDADQEVEIPIGGPVSIHGTAVLENQPDAYLQGNQIVLDLGPGFPLFLPAVRTAPMVRNTRESLGSAGGFSTVAGS